MNCTEGCFGNYKEIHFPVVMVTETTCKYLCESKETTKAWVAHVSVMADFCLRKYWRCYATIFLHSLSLTFVHSFILFLYFLLIVCIRISLINNRGSYRPFIPLRNLWSRRDILPCPFTVRWLSLTNKSTQLRRSLLAAWVHEGFIAGVAF